MYSNFAPFFFYRTIPKYLLPRGMQVADLNRKRKRRRKGKGTGGLKRSDNDPLQSFDGGDLNLDGLGGADDDNEQDQEMPDFGGGDSEERDSKRQKSSASEDKKIYGSSMSNTGKSTAGRNAWKEKHRKGQFSGKKRKSDRKKKDPLGI